MSDEQPVPRGLVCWRCGSRTINGARVPLDIDHVGLNLPPERVECWHCHQCAQDLIVRQDAQEHLAMIERHDSVCPDRTCSPIAMGQFYVPRDRGVEAAT